MSGRLLLYCRGYNFRIELIAKNGYTNTAFAVKSHEALFTKVIQ